jgi:hypothetical protein
MNIFIKAKILSRQDKRKEALDLLLTVPEQFLSSEVFVRRGDLMQITDNDFTFEFIEEQYICAIEINGDSAEAHFELGKFYGFPTVLRVDCSVIDDATLVFTMV